MDERRDDWRNSVDARLVNLTSAQKSADIDIERLKRTAFRDDKIMRGDPENNLPGLIETMNHLANEINKFNRIFDKDYLGHGGLVSFITYIYNQERDRQKAQELNTGYKWGFWGLIAAAVIAAAAVLITNRDQLAKWLPKYHPAPLEAKIDRARHPRNRYHHYTVHVSSEGETITSP
jgi:hypothetical protein